MKKQNVILTHSSLFLLRKKHRQARGFLDNEAIKEKIKHIIEMRYRSSFHRKNYIGVFFDDEEYLDQSEVNESFF